MKTSELIEAIIELAGTKFQSHTYFKDFEVSIYLDTGFWSAALMRQSQEEAFRLKNGTTYISNGCAVVEYEQLCFSEGNSLNDALENLLSSLESK